MARRISKKCVECAQLSATDAQQLHGKGKKGDGCWHDKRCPGKRSYYRNRQRLNEQRRLQYQQQLKMPLIEVWIAALLGGLELEQKGNFYQTQEVWVSKCRWGPIVERTQWS